MSRRFLQRSSAAVGDFLLEGREWRISPRWKTNEGAEVTVGLRVVFKIIDIPGEKWRPISQSNLAIELPHKIQRHPGPHGLDRTFRRPPGQGARDE